MLKLTLRIIGALLCALVLIVAIGGGCRLYRQQAAVAELAINTPNGIVEASFQSIGGIEQWIQIRGEDRSNPVILFLHGGPSLSMIPFTYRALRTWEKQFIVVHWDQRGAGRTYIHNGGPTSPPTTIGQLSSDGIEVAEYLRKHLHKERIIVVGESFGSVIGIEMARQRPDLFHAYAGTGQIVNMAETQITGYRLLTERISATGNEKLLRQLQALGPPPFTDATTRGAEQQLMSQFTPISEHDMGKDFIFAPEYSLRDLYALLFGATRHRAGLVDEEMHYDAIARGTRFDIPLFFFQGSDDLFAPTELVAEFLSKATAPEKELIVIAGGGHNSFYGAADVFLRELVTRVRPLAVSAGVKR